MSDAPMTIADLASCILDLQEESMRQQKTITDLQAQNTRLREALKDCADDLEEWVKAAYASTLHYPSEARKMERDLGNVNKARAALTESKPGSAPPVPSHTESEHE